MSKETEAPLPTDSAVEITVYGDKDGEEDARKLTRQVWFGEYPDSAFGHGRIPGYEVSDDD